MSARKPVLPFSSAADAFPLSRPAASRQWLTITNTDTRRWLVPSRIPRRTILPHAVARADAGRVARELRLAIGIRFYVTKRRACGRDNRDLGHALPQVSGRVANPS